MSDMKKFFLKTIDKHTIFFVFILEVLMQYISIPKEQLYLISDNIGMLASPTYFAGINWQSLLSLSEYYGPGFYILYTPLFIFIKDPIIIMNVMVFGNECIMGLAAVVLYLILFKLNFKNKIHNMIVSVLAVRMAYYVNMNITNEPMIILLQMLITFVAIKMINANGIKSQIKWQVLILLLELYSLSVHSRNIVFVFAFALSMIILMLILKKKIGSILLLGLSVVISFYFSKIFPSIVVANIYGGQIRSAKNASVGASVNSNVLLGVFEYFNNFIGIIVGNIYGSFINTNGIILFVYGLAFCFIFFLCKKIFVDQEHSYSNNKMNWALVFILLFSFICYGFGFVAICMTGYTWPRAVSYWRYYGTYVAPLIAIALLLYGNVKKWKNKAVLSILILGKFFLTFSYPIIDGTYYTGWTGYGFMDLSKFIPFYGEKEFGQRIILTSIALIILIVIYCSIKKKGTLLVFAICLHVVISFASLEFPKITISERCDTGYQVIRNLREEGIISDEIAFYGSEDGYRYYQYMLLDITVEWKESTSEIGNDGIIFSDCKIEGNHWNMLQLDDNEYMYIKDDSVFEEVQDRLM